MIHHLLNIRAAKRLKEADCCLLSLCLKLEGQELHHCLIGKVRSAGHSLSDSSCCLFRCFRSQSLWCCFRSRGNIPCGAIGLFDCAKMFHKSTSDTGASRDHRAPYRTIRYLADETIHTHAVSRRREGKEVIASSRFNTEFSPCPLGAPSVHDDRTI